MMLDKQTPHSSSLTYSLDIDAEITFDQNENLKYFSKILTDGMLQGLVLNVQSFRQQQQKNIYKLTKFLFVSICLHKLQFF